MGLDGQSRQRSRHGGLRPLDWRHDDRHAWGLQFVRRTVYQGNPSADLGVAAVDCLFGFTGRPFDTATELQNNDNRWYEPSTQRWLSPDPVGTRSGLEPVPLLRQRPDQQYRPVRHVLPGHVLHAADIVFAGIGLWKWRSSAFGSTSVAAMNAQVSRTIRSFGSIPGGLDLNSLGIDLSALGPSMPTNLFGNTGTTQGSSGSVSIPDVSQLVSDMGPNYLNTIATTISSGSPAYILPSGNATVSLPPLFTPTAPTEGFTTGFRSQRSRVSADFADWHLSNIAKLPWGQVVRRHAEVPCRGRGSLPTNLYPTGEFRLVDLPGSGTMPQACTPSQTSISFAPPGTPILKTFKASRRSPQQPLEHSGSYGVGNADTEHFNCLLEANKQFYQQNAGAIGFAVVVSAANGVMTAITDANQCAGLELIADPTSSPDDALHNIQYFRDVTTSTWALIFGSVDKERRQYDAQGNPLQTKMEAFLDTAEHYWSAQKINREAANPTPVAGCRQCRSGPLSRRSRVCSHRKSIRKQVSGGNSW